MGQENKGQWRALAMLFIALTFSMSTWFSASAVIPQLRELWGLSSNTAAWFTIAVQLGFVVGALVSSLFNLSDIISPRYVILGGSVGAAIANVLLSIASGPGIGIALRFATGFFLAGVYPPAFKLISTWFRENRGLALGILAAAIVAGSGVPHLINGLGGIDWLPVIFATSAITFVGGLIAAFAIKEGPYPFPKATFDPRQIGQVFSNRGVRLASTGYISHMWELYAMYTWFFVFFRDALIENGINPGSTPSFATFGTFLTGSLGCWLGGVIADRWGREKTTILMLATSGSCALLIGLFFNASPWLILIIGLIWGLTIVADSAQFSTLVTELADQSYVGTALTLQLASGFLITVATIWLIPLVETLVSWRWAFAILAPGPIVGIIAMLRLKNQPKTLQQ